METSFPRNASNNSEEWGEHENLFLSDISEIDQFQIRYYKNLLKSVNNPPRENPQNSIFYVGIQQSAVLGFDEVDADVSSSFELEKKKRNQGKNVSSSFDLLPVNFDRAEIYRSVLKF